jgi:hypothetical protein
MAFQKNLFRYRPGSEQAIEARTTQKRTKPVPCDPRSIEPGVRRSLADKAMGNLAGVWLLIPELLRLGARDLVCGRTGQSPGSVGRFQGALGEIRRASGHFRGRLLAVDPHRVRGSSKRPLRRHRHDARGRPTKTAPTFFVRDVDTGQPIRFTTGTSARTAAVAAEGLLTLAGEILDPRPGQAPVLADWEHFTAELLDRVKTGTSFDLLVPMPDRPRLRAKLRAVPPGAPQPRWAGYATAKRPSIPQDSQAGPFYRYIQRQGERPEDYRFNASLSTRDGDEVAELTREFPKRRHVEEFFDAPQAPGWNRAGTCNLNIR